MGWGRFFARVGGYAGVGAAAAAIGAAILETTGHGEYSALDAAKIGAAGNAAMGAATWFAEKIFQECCSQKELAILAEFISSIGTVTLGGILGRTILSFMLSHMTEMSLEQTAAALVVGSSSMMGGAIATTLLIAGCCAAANACSNQISNIKFNSFFGQTNETKTEAKAPSELEAAASPNLLTLT